MVAHSLNELQRLIADLRPSHLDDLGLPATLRWYCSELQKRAGLQISVEFQGEVFAQPAALPAEIKTALFRVAQEALTNIVRHAHARSAQVRLACEAGGVILSVEDDGCGFDSERLARGGRPSWGLLGMEERANLLGGELTITSRLGLGTRVAVRIPYDIDPAGCDKPPAWAQEETEYENTPAFGR
jgi:two-component system sensor histidine kinase UhpB